MTPEMVDLRNAFRFDRQGGFLIVKDGAPFQVLIRYCGHSFYWLATVDGFMHGDMAVYIYSTYAAEILAEFERTH